MSSHLGTVGTAGHIDHGKTSLVQALTGVDTDRLAEEKARGITIELGFAELDLGDGRTASVVDVPGHEGFVRTMVAGASGIDVGLLVVAADEGVMPQTTEHLAVLRLLGVGALIVVMTKLDLVEGEWADLVQEEIAELLVSTPYAGAAVVRTSARTGEGLSALRSEIGRHLESSGRRDSDDLFRLPVDRSFSIRGTGTVVTGTVWSGRVAVGDRLYLRPGDGEVRVRGVQAHGRPVGVAQAGHRAALALGGPDAEQVRRGHILTNEADWEASRRLTVWAELLPGAGPWRRGQRVRVHLGTAEVIARVLPLGRDVLDEGATGWTEVRLSEPLPARAGDRLVFRGLSPVRTQGGGKVLEPHPPRRSRKDPVPVEALAAFSGGSVVERVEVVLRRAGREGVTRSLLPVLTGCRASECGRALEQLGAPQRGGTVYGAGVVEGASSTLEAWVQDQLAADRLSPGVPPEAARAAAGGGHVADLALERLIGSAVMELAEGLVRPTGYRAQPGEGERRRLEALEGVYRAAGLEPPGVEQAGVAATEADPWPLVRHLEREGRLVRVDGDLFIWASSMAAVRDRVTVELGGRTGLGPMDFRPVIPVSRRHLIPILGYLDREGVTHRDDNGRTVPMA